MCILFAPPALTLTLSPSLRYNGRSRREMVALAGTSTLVIILYVPVGATTDLTRFKLTDMVFTVSILLAFNRFILYTLFEDDELVKNPDGVVGATTATV
jgi:hypothetical protein